VTALTFTHKKTKCSHRSIVSLVSNLSLSRKQPLNLKPLHSCRCGFFREAQLADCLM